jgi:tetratricopeptide (TPR) repeat protein
MVLVSAAAVPDAAADATTGRSPASIRIDAAGRRIAGAPEAAAGYTALASAFAELARETADPAYYARAQQAVEAALDRAPEDPAAQRLAIWILLGQHEFARARERAEAMRARAPDDIAVYPLLVDAYVELGEYALAEEAAQRMLDLRPDYVPGLARAAYLRELFGDLDGALDLLATCLHQTPESETEQRAWYLAHLGHVERLLDRLDAAASSAESALATFPDYHYALALLADVRADQGRIGDALALARRHVAVAPHPENRLRVAELLEELGRGAEARAEFAQFESGARAETESGDNANRELVFHLAEQGADRAGALRIAQRERTRRRDVATLEAHAWALHRNGRHDEARAEIEAVIAVGVRDPRVFYHAGAIARAQGDERAARRWLEAATAQIPGSRWAALAKAELAAPGPRRFGWPVRGAAVAILAACAALAFVVWSRGERRRSVRQIPA